MLLNSWKIKLIYIFFNEEQKVYPTRVSYLGLKCGPPITEGPVAQRIRHLTTNQGIPGSNPGVVEVLYFCPILLRNLLLLIIFCGALFLWFLGNLIMDIIRINVHFGWSLTGGSTVYKYTYFALSWIKKEFSEGELGRWLSLVIPPITSGWRH